MEEIDVFETMIDYAQAPSFDFSAKQFRTVALLKEEKVALDAQKTFKYGDFDMLDYFKQYGLT